VAKTAIEQTGMDIKYDSLKGGLLDGLDIKGFNYEDKVKANLKLKADFKSTSSGVIHVEDLNISNLWIDEEFLNSLMSDSNESEKKQESTESFIKKLIVDSATLNLVDFHYKEYAVKELNLQIDDLSYDIKKDIKAKIKADFKSNVADAIIKADIKDEKYKFHIIAEPKKEYITPFIKEQNITIQVPPHIVLDGDGDFHKVRANAFVTKTKLSFQDIKISPKDLNLTADFDIDTNNLDTKFLALIDSLVADIDIDLRAKLNIKDINNTLDFDLKSNLQAKAKYLEKYTKEQNITIKKMPKLYLTARGDFDKIFSRVVTDEGKIIYNDINILPKSIDLNSTYSLKKGDLSAKIVSDVLSDVANFDLNGDVTLNTNDINNTIKIDLQSHLLPIQKYFDKNLKDKNITVKKMPKFLLDIHGDFKEILLKANLTEGDIKYNSFKIKPKTTSIDATLA
jgi:hypothetical protein